MAAAQVLKGKLGIGSTSMMKPILATWKWQIANASPLRFQCNDASSLQYEEIPSQNRVLNHPAAASSAEYDRNLKERTCEETGLHIYNYWFIYSSIHVFIYLFIYLFIHVFIYLFTYLFMYLCIYSFIYLSIIYLLFIHICILYPHQWWEKHQVRLRRQL